MPIEIDETELANLRRVAGIADIISKHPKARAMMQEAVKLAAPDQVGPETILRSEFSEGLAAIREELKADREAREKAAKDRDEAESLAKLQTRWAGGQAKARNAGYTAEGIEQLEKFMEERGIADHELAMLAYEKANPPPEPVVTGNQAWNFLGNTAEPPADIKALLDGNEEGFLATAIPQAIASVRGR